MERAIRPQGHLAQIIVVADAAHDEVLTLRRRFRRRRAAAPVLSHPFLHLGRRAVVDSDVMAPLVLEMSRHGIAHHAKTEKSHLRHPVLPRALPCSRSDAYMRE